jgi:hypothetical protein
MYAQARMKKKYNLRNALIILTAVFLVAVGYILIFKNHSIPSNNSVPADFKLTRISSGGLSGSGTGQNYVISADGIMKSDTSVIKSGVKNNLSKHLNSQQMEQLVGKIKDANFFKLNSQYPPKGACCDQFDFTIKITMNGRTNSTTYSEGYDAPRELINLDTYITQLAQ